LPDLPNWRYKQDPREDEDDQIPSVGVKQLSVGRDGPWAVMEIVEG